MDIKCSDCEDPITGEFAEEVCLARRETGVCPQNPILRKLRLQLTWLASQWKENGALKEDCSVEEILAMAERNACERE